jgi:branched-chain amino acid transport system permease protein
VSDFGATYSTLIQLILLNATLGLSMYPVMACGMFSVAGPGFMAIGAYAAAIIALRAGLPAPVGASVGLAISLILALLLARPLLRLRSHYFAVATIGWVQVIYVVLLNWTDLSNGVLGLNRIPVEVETWHLVLYVLVVAYAMRQISRSRIGRAFRAIRYDERVAAGMSINVAHYKTLAFVLSAVIASISGSLFAHLTRFIDPNEFTFALALNFLGFAVLGGTAVWAGPIVGAVILTALPELLRGFGEHRDLVTGAALLLAIVYLPRGLADPLLFRHWRQRLASRWAGS